MPGDAVGLTVEPRLAPARERRRIDGANEAHVGVDVDQHGRVDEVRRRKLYQLLDEPAFGGNHRRRRKPPAAREGQLPDAFGDDVLDGRDNRAPAFQRAKKREVAAIHEEIMFGRFGPEAQDALV
jgi:hypothetical protein